MSSLSPFVTPPHLELSLFSGPFDLLFQLAQKGEISWNDLLLREVATQFDLFSEVDEKSAFLSHFVHLTWLKVQSYFPPEEVTEGEEQQPLSILEVITSYQIARSLRTQLEEQESLSSLIHRRAPLPAAPKEKGLEGVALQELERLFKGLLEKHNVKTLLPPEIEIPIQQILEQLIKKLSDPLPFENIFCHSERKEWIPLFLAILEGIKQERILLLEDGMLWKNS